MPVSLAFELSARGNLEAHWAIRSALEAVGAEWGRGMPAARYVTACSWVD